MRKLTVVKLTKGRHLETEEHGAADFLWGYHEGVLDVVGYDEDGQPFWWKSYFHPVTVEMVEQEE